MPLNNPITTDVPVKVASLTVNFNDSSPVTIVTLPIGCKVLSVIANVLVAFLGTSPTVEIGDATDPDGFMLTSQVFVTSTGWRPLAAINYGAYLYHATNKKLFKQYTAATAVIATIGGTSLTAGQVKIYIIYVEP